MSEASVAGAYRRARPDEVPALVALVESAYRGEPAESAWTTEAHLIGGQRVDRDMLGAAMADPRTAVLVRVDPTGELVACCELRQLDGAVASFGMFAVSPDRQAAGVGRELLEEAERVVVREWGATRMELSVIDVRIELVDWYRRRGYEPTGEQQPFPYGDERFGRPRRDDLRFVVLAKDLVVGDTDRPTVPPVDSTGR